MNRKQLTLILVAVVVLGGLGLWLRNRQAASFKTTQGNMGQKVLGEFDLNTIAQISIRQGSNELNLVQQDETWTVKERGGYPANFSEVSDFVRKLWQLKTVQAPQVGPSQLARLELTTTGDKAGTLVDLKDKTGKTVKSLLLGKKHQRQPESPSPFGGEEGFPDGRYVMIVGKTDTVSLVSETFSSIEPKPEQWLNKDFFKVDKVKSVAVTYTNTTNSWKLSRDTENGELKLAEAKPEEKLDASKVSGIPNALAWPSFNDIVVDPKPDVTGLDKPTVAELETFDNFTYTIKVGNKHGDDAYYVALAVKASFPKERTPGKDEKPEDKQKLDKEFKEKTDKLSDKYKQERAYEKWVYLVSKWSLDSLLKDRGALLVEKKEEPKPGTGTNAPPAAVHQTPNPVDAVLPPTPPPAPPAPTAKPADPKPADNKDAPKP